MSSDQPDQSNSELHNLQCYCGAEIFHQWAPTSQCCPPSQDPPASPSLFSSSPPASQCCPPSQDPPASPSLFSSSPPASQSCPPSQDPPASPSLFSSSPPASPSLFSSQPDEITYSEDSQSVDSWGSWRLPPSLVDKYKDGSKTQTCENCNLLRQRIQELETENKQLREQLELDKTLLNSTRKMATNRDLYNKIKVKTSNSDLIVWLKSVDNNLNKPSDSSYRKLITNCQTTYRRLQKSQKTEKGQHEFETFLNSSIKFPEPNQNPRNTRKTTTTQPPCTSTSNDCSYRNVSHELARENVELKLENQELNELKKSKVPKKTLQDLRSTIKSQNKLLNHLTRKLKFKTKILKRIRLQNTRLTQKITSLNTKANESIQEMSDLRTTYNELENTLRNTENDLQANTNTLRDIEAERDWLADMVRENDTVKFYDSSERKFCAELRQCIYKLLSLNVSAQNVSSVIESVLKMLGKTYDKLPARSTILNMNIERLILSQQQLSEVIPEKENLTIYTDETSKFGVKYSGYHVSDEGGNMYVLGMRQLETKSSQNTLNVFQEILEDIEDKSVEANATSKNILMKITATMSDRASTEKKFNTLLQELRSEVVPELTENWDHLSQEEQTSVSTLLNFFCGLHSLVHFAEVSNKSLIEIENGHFNNEPPVFDKSFMKATESSAVRLIRTTSKALARGADEKSGKFNDFNNFVKQFLKANKLHSIPLQEFRGNRFNVIFESAAGVFFLKDKIEEFLNANQGNRLLKAVLHDIREPMYMAEVKALGLISRLITGPLWCLIEDKSIHILDMNIHYLELVVFFSDALADIQSFMKGELKPFGEVTRIKDDALLHSLVQEWEHDDKVVVSLNVLLPALCQLSKRIFADHLPAGKWEHTTEEMRRRSAGSAKHNKYAESVFGYLDTLLRIKPNVSVLASEAFIMFTANKTNVWLESKNEDEQASLISKAMRNVPKVRENYKERAAIIQENQRRRLEETIQQAEAAEQRRLARLEEYSKKIIYFGLWQSEAEVNSAFNEMKTKTDKLQALKAQLNFRRYVLKQCPKDTSCYLQSTEDNGKKRKLTVEELKANVVKLVKHAFTIQPEPTADSDNQPVLTGKEVQHCFIEDGERKWWTGKVISQVPGYPEYFNIVYTRDQAVYVYKLLDDYKAGDLKLVLQ